MLTGGSPAARGRLCIHETLTLNGDANITFHADVASPSVAPDRAVVVSNFVCFTSFGPSTTNGRIVITPSGKVNGSCHFSP